MYWEEEREDTELKQAPDDIVDLGFRIDCPTLPLEHAGLLSEALCHVLPWLRSESRAGIHLIHGAASGNGWQRPQDAGQEVLHLSRRTRLILRLPKERLHEARSLSGTVLDIAGHPLVVGQPKVQLLSLHPVVFSRYVLGEAENEERFLAQIVDELNALDITVRKVLCGKLNTLQLPSGPQAVRSVMVADLKPEESVRLQQYGIGSGRLLGCGLFIPHKDIKPVAGGED